MSNQFSVTMRTPRALPRAAIAFSPSTDKASASAVGLAFPAITRAFSAPSSAAASIHDGDPCKVALARGGIGDVAIVDQQRLNDNAAGFERFADFGEIGRVLAGQIEVADFNAEVAAFGEFGWQPLKRHRAGTE